MFRQRCKVRSVLTVVRSSFQDFRGEVLMKICRLSSQMFSSLVMDGTM